MLHTLISWTLLSLTMTLGQTPSGSDLLESADQVLLDVARIRQLQPKKPIAKGLKSRRQIESYIRGQLEENYPPEDVLAEQKLLIKLGVIPDNTDLGELIVELYTEQIAGLYDFESSKFYIADWIPLEIQKPVMAHELTHALQDQHFDLSDLLQPEKNNDDAMLAKAALVEGEGFAVMLQYVLDNLGTSFLDIPDIVELSRTNLEMTAEQYQVLTNAPDYLRESLLFPYVYGARFMQTYVRRHGWKNASSLYKEVPESTEQILHPEKYMNARDVPVSVDSPGSFQPLVDGWDPIYRNVLGEFSLMLLLKQFIEQSAAERASAGWGGDMVELYEAGDGRLTLFLRSVWDSDQDAREFFDAYRSVIEEKYPGARLLPSTQLPNPGEFGQSAWETRQDKIQLRWEGTQVDVIEFTSVPDGKTDSSKQPAAEPSQ